MLLVSFPVLRTLYGKAIIPEASSNPSASWFRACFPAESLGYNGLGQPDALSELKSWTPVLVILISW